MYIILSLISNMSTWS